MPLEFQFGVFVSQRPLAPPVQLKLTAESTTRRITLPEVSRCAVRPGGTAPRTTLPVPDKEVNSISGYEPVTNGALRMLRVLVPLSNSAPALMGAAAVPSNWMKLIVAPAA